MLTRVSMDWQDADSLRDRLAENLRRFDVEEIERPGLRRAAVAVAIVPDGERRLPSLLLTRRAAGLRRHAGQWALPGGRVDDGETTEEAALRELREELGVPEDGLDRLGRLDDYATRSGFVITPWVFFSCDAMELQPDPTEVASVHAVPLASLDRPDIPILDEIPESDRPVLSMPVLEHRIHAPTAAILYQLVEVALRGRGTRVAHYEQPVFAWR